ESVGVVGLVGTFCRDLPFPLIVAASGAIGYFVAQRSPALLGLKSGAQQRAEPIPDRWLQATRSMVWGVLLWWAPIGIVVLALGTSHVLVDIGIFFSKLAVVSFGGA